jgi:NitT/TauT family transport system permease protein
VSRVRLIQTLIIGGSVALLEVLCRTGVIDRFTMIPPSDMLLSLIRIARTESWFWPDVLYTLRNLAVAIVIAVAGGFLIGVGVHAVPRLRRCLDPLFSSYYSVPTFVLYPLLIVIFGIGPASLIVMGALFGVVAMIVATLTALDRIPKVMVKTARIMRLDPLRSVLMVRLPAAAPHLFTGLKLAVAYCVIGVIAGEFILATAGIGRRLSFSYNNFDNQTMYGVLLLILVFAAALNTVLNIWEKRLHQRWYR